MKRFFVVVALLALTAHADGVFLQNQGGRTSRVDGGFSPVTDINCGANLLCTQNRTTGTGTIALNGWHGTQNYAFGTLQAANSGGPFCVVATQSISVKGAEIGDWCIPTSNHGVDGGALLSDDVILTCAVTAANAAKVKACNRQMDGGTVALTDAGYSVLTFHF